MKVLDFGLAKPTGGLAGTFGTSELPTEAKTEQGVIVGTVSYMSAEQAQGKVVDARSDIFSLGIVFYEMLTGRRPFQGDTPTEVLSSIIKEVPTPIAEIRAGIPRELSRLVRRCLEKDPSRRIQSALDVRNELQELKREVDSGELVADAPSLSPRRSRLGIALGAAGAAAAIVVLLFLSGLIAPRSSQIAVPRLENPVQLTSAAGVENHPTWSPDGGRIAYDSDQTGNLDIWVTQATGGAAVNFTADHDGFDHSPAWSPDGSQIAFVSERNGGGIFLIPAIGGLPVKVSASNMVLANPVWSADGTELAYIIVEPETAIEIVSQSTRKVRRLTIPGVPGNRWDLSWSRDGRFFAYGQGTGREFTQLWVLRASDGQAFAVTDGAFSDTCPMWSRDGRTIFFLSSRGGSMDLWQRRIAEDGEPQGDAAPLTVGVGIQYRGSDAGWTENRLFARPFDCQRVACPDPGGSARRLGGRRAAHLRSSGDPISGSLTRRGTADRGLGSRWRARPLDRAPRRERDETSDERPSDRWCRPLVARRRADRLHVQQKWKSGHLDYFRGRRVRPFS